MSINVPKYLDPRRYARRLRAELTRATFDVRAAEQEERTAFTDAGLDRAAGEARLNEALTKLGSRPFDHAQGDDSVHWLLFSCLSLTAWGDEVRDILEIGTFRGKTTALLKLLFPKASIVTCDLPEADPILKASYGRQDPQILRDHRERRQQNLALAEARFIEANSFFLPSLAPGPYDLIWVDGGHVFPEIAWDACNAWHMCRAGGRILFDDVFTHPRGGDGTYGNSDTEQVLKYLASRTDSKPLYFLKRLNPKWSGDPRHRKFVTVLSKPKSAD